MRPSLKTSGSPTSTGWRSILIITLYRDPKPIEASRLKSAAHGTPSVVPGEGIVLSDVQWTPEGEEFVGGGHYIDLSPTLQLNADGEAVFLHSAAVCRQGAIPDLSLFSAEAVPPQLLALSTKPKTMDPKKLLAALLGVSEDASDTDFEDAAKTFAANSKTSASKMATLSSTVEGLTAFTGEGKTFKSFADLPARLEQVITSVAKLEGFHQTAQRNEIVRDATLQGKAIPQTALEGENQLSNAQLKALCASLPVTVPLDQRTVALSADVSATAATNTEELAVFSALGLSKDQVAKHTK